MSKWSSKANPTIALHVTARELAVLRKAVPYMHSYGTLTEKMNRAEKEVRVAVREARRELKKEEAVSD